MIPAIQVMAAIGSAATVWSTWNPSDKNANVTLSNGNKTASVGNGLVGAVRGTNGHSTGKYYFEINVGASPDSFEAVGLGNAMAGLASFPGSDANGWGLRGNGNTYTNNSPTAYTTSWAANDVISILIDFSTGTLVFWKNGTSLGTAYTSLSGTLFPMWGTNLGSPTTVVANFGATAFAFTPPGGYVGWS